MSALRGQPNGYHYFTSLVFQSRMGSYTRGLYRRQGQAGQLLTQAEVTRVLLDTNIVVNPHQASAYIRRNLRENLVVVGSLLGSPGRAVIYRAPSLGTLRDMLGDDSRYCVHLVLPVWRGEGQRALYRRPGGILLAQWEASWLLVVIGMFEYYAQAMAFIRERLPGNLHDASHGALSLPSTSVQVASLERRARPTDPTRNP